MNMHGIMTPADTGEYRERDPLAARIRQWIWRRRVFSLIVVLPLALLSFYLFAIASDQYESEAHFLVHSQSISEAPSGVSQVLGLVSGGSSSSQSDAMSVSDYLTSHDAVAALQQHDQLVERFNRPDIDLFSRLGKAHPTPEQLLKYYRKQVIVDHSTDTGITTLKVRSFRPEDSFEIIQRLIQLGEQRVNFLNLRSYEDAVSTAQRQLAQAESEVAVSQSRMTQYRQSRGDVNPTASAAAQIQLVATLNGQLTSSRAQLVSMGNMIDHASPQYRAIASRVQALEAQVAGQSAKLTGGNQTIAAKMGGYEDLQLRQEFLSKRYEAAAAALEKAREQAIRQQLYLVRVVEPNLPVKSTYPQRWRILTTVSIALLLAYSIGWLIVAGVREHAA